MQIHFRPVDYSHNLDHFDPHWLVQVTNWLKRKSIKLSSLSARRSIVILFWPFRRMEWSESIDTIKSPHRSNAVPVVNFTKANLIELFGMSRIALLIFNIWMYFMSDSWDFGVPAEKYTRQFQFKSDGLRFALLKSGYNKFYGNNCLSELGSIETYEININGFNFVLWSSWAAIWENLTLRLVCHLKWSYLRSRTSLLNFTGWPIDVKKEVSASRYVNTETNLYTCHHLLSVPFFFKFDFFKPSLKDRLFFNNFFFVENFFIIY